MHRGRGRRQAREIIACESLRSGRGPCTYIFAHSIPAGSADLQLVALVLAVRLWFVVCMCMHMLVLLWLCAQVPPLFFVVPHRPFLLVVVLIVYCC